MCVCECVYVCVCVCVCIYNVCVFLHACVSHDLLMIVLHSLRLTTSRFIAGWQYCQVCGAAVHESSLVQ